MYLRLHLCNRIGNIWQYSVKDGDLPIGSIHSLRSAVQSKARGAPASTSPLSPGGYGTRLRAACLCVHIHLYRLGSHLAQSMQHFDVTRSFESRL